MSYGYVQMVQYHPDCKAGLLYVYIAGGTDLATIYNPVSGDPIANPLDIDAEGYTEAFWVQTDTFYDVRAVDYLGASKFTRQNVAVNGGGSGLPGPKGDDGGKGDKGDKGDSGADGINGTNGTNGTNGIDGVAGVSLEIIAVDGTSQTGRIIYKLSNSPEWIVAGDILPGGMGQVTPQAGAPLTYMNSAISADETISITRSNAGVSMTVPAIATITDDIVDINTELDVIDARVTALEGVSPMAEVHFGGAFGATSVIIPHTLNTDNLFVTCYNTIDNSVIYESIIVSASQVSVSNLAPLEATNQIKVVLMRAPVGV